MTRHSNIIRLTTAMMATVGGISMNAGAEFLRGGVHLFCRWLNAKERLPARLAKAPAKRAGGQALGSA